MSSAEVSATFSAPPERIWEFVRWENAEVLERAGFFTHVDYDERRAIAGAMRTLVGERGSVRERLEETGPPPFSYVYRIVDAGPLPIRDYVGRVCIEPDGDRGSRLTVRSTFETVGISEDAWLATYTSMQQALFEYIRAQTEA